LGCFAALLGFNIYRRRVDCHREVPRRVFLVLFLVFLIIGMMAPRKIVG
jgi:hypothetical protein